MEADEQTIRNFAHRYGAEFEHKCDFCSTIVTHKAVSIEKTKDHAIVNYADCPGKVEAGHRRGGAHTIIPLSPNEKAHWQDIFWGIRGAMAGIDPTFIPPIPKQLDEDRVIHLGEDEPYAVLYKGTCNFISLLAVANEGWDQDAPPFCEEFCEYIFAIENKNGSWKLHVDPSVPGAQFVTIVYWDQPVSTQRGA